MVIRRSGRHSARRSKYGCLGVTMSGKADMDLKIHRTTCRAGDRWAAHPPPFTAALLAASSFTVNHPSQAVETQPQRATFTQDISTRKGIGDRRATKQHHHAFASQWDHRNGFARRRCLPKNSRRKMLHQRVSSQ